MKAKTGANPRGYPDTMTSAESGRPMKRGLKLVTITVGGQAFDYYQPGWWCDLSDPEDREGQLVDEDNQVARMARLTAESIARGEDFGPALIRAIRLRLDLTQAEAGRVFGVGPNAFDKYERGEITPSEPTKRLLKLALERPDLFKKPKKGGIPLPKAPNVTLIKRTLREARLDRLYGPLYRDRKNVA
jgi:HTH-type transcriptional regulator/antitoxin MqsA